MGPNAGLDKISPSAPYVTESAVLGVRYLELTPSTLLLSALSCGFNSDILRSAYVLEIAASISFLENSDTLSLFFARSSRICLASEPDIEPAAATLDAWLNSFL